MRERGEEEHNECIVVREMRVETGAGGEVGAKGQSKAADCGDCEMGVQGEKG